MAGPVPGFADQAGEAAWRAAVDKVLKGADFDTLVGRTADGLPVGPLYPKAEKDAVPAGFGVARPGLLMQRADHPDPEAACRQAAEDLDGGADGLVLTFEGSPLARGFGLRAEDGGLDRVLAGISLDKVPLRLETAPFAGRAARLALAKLVDQRGHGPAAPNVDFGIDPIGSMARTGLSTAPWPTLAARMVAVADALLARGFAGPLLRADGRPYHEAGASEAQELASVLATGLAYLRALELAGHSLDAARGLLGFTLAADADLFAGLAKFRALRRLWAGVEAACGLEPKPIRLHVETSWRMITRRDPWSNMLRATIGCAAAALGGADSITVLPFTAAVGLPDGFARRLARNTHLILFAEAHLGRVADPAAGAGGFEALTEALCDEAWTLLQASEREGGIAGSLAAGHWQARIGLTRSHRRETFANGTGQIVGTTIYPDPGEAAPPVLPVSPGVTRALPSGPEIVRFEALPSQRDAEAFEARMTP